MVIIVCVDNAMGVLFNGKRQSKDFILRNHLLNIVEQANAHLILNEYSYRQFRMNKRDHLLNVKHDDLLFEDETSIEYVFIESEEAFNGIPWNLVDSLILCHWNRDYPADFYLKIPENISYELLSQEELDGSSHLMTIETYTKITSESGDSNEKE